MNRISLGDVKIQPGFFATWPRAIRRGLFLCFVASWALALAHGFFWLPIERTAAWPDGLLLALAACTSLAWLTGQYPPEKVMGTGILITLIAGALVTVGALTSIPFGPFTYERAAGRVLAGPLPWTIPLLWIVVILSSRGTARLLLRRWRHTNNYGYRLLGLTMLLALVFDLNLEPYATQIRHYWRWTPTRLPLDWYSAPVVNFFGWSLVSLCVLIAVMPLLLQKKPGPEPPAYEPGIVWLSLHLVFTIGAARAQLWPAFWVGSVIVAGSGAAFLITRPRRVNSA